MYSNIFILIKYTTQKFSLVFCFFILIFFWSCTNTEFQNLNEGVKFINVFDENTNYIDEKITEDKQKFIGRLFVVVVAVAALFVAIVSTDALVMLGGLAVAYGFQMYPALFGNLYCKWISKTGVTMGLIAGLLAVTLTDKMSSVFSLPWGAYPLTIHSAGWGIFFNIIFTGLGSYFFPDSDQKNLDKEKRHAFLSEVAGLPESKKKLIPLAYGLVIFWFLFGFGPFAMIGNTLFSDPNMPATWAPFNLPSIWIWQLVFLFFGIFVMWFLAFYMGFSQPISLKKLEDTFNNHYK